MNSISKSKNKIEITKKEYKKLQQAKIKYQSIMAYDHYINDLGYEDELVDCNEYDFDNEYVCGAILASKFDLTYSDFYDILVINKVIKEDFQWTGEVYSKYKKNINSEIEGLECFENDNQYAIILGDFVEDDDGRYLLLFPTFTDKGAKWVKKNIEKWTSKYLLHKLSQK